MRTYDRMNKEIIELLNMTDLPMNKYAAQRIQELEEQNSKLLAFVKEIMGKWPHGYIDGGYLQDVALDCGILEETEATEACGPLCQCDNFPTKCYRYSEWFQEAIGLTPNKDIPF